MGMDLFDGSDDTVDISKIETNQEFARRYEHNKKREDLQRLEELKKKGVIGDSDDSSSESEDDDEADLGKNDLQFLNVLVKVKEKDPIIKQKDAKLFESDSDEEESEEEGEDNRKSAKGKGKGKPMYLKDVVAKQLIEDGPELEEEEMKNSGVKSYYQEQDEFKKAFLNAADEVFGEDDEGDLLIEKKKGEDEEEGDGEVKKRWDKYFGEGELDEKEKFLRDFFVNKMWKNDNKGKKPVSEDLYILSEDEDAVEEQEKYEAEYNFRHEEGAGDRVLGHSRFTEGTVRKKTNARAVQRKNKEERMAQAEFERKEELKHLKNLKKKEIMEKLDKIRAIAGIAEGGACALNEHDLEEDFDPNEYDRKMKETFDVDYYEDPDPVYGDEENSDDDDDIEKPDFDKEDELLGLPKDWDVCGSGDGFAAVREKVLKSGAQMKDDEIMEESDQKEEELPEEGKRKRKRKIPLREKVAFDKDLEEYYKLDYEDTIGDLKTRFKYAPVKSERYRLKTEDIINLDDKVLNGYVPMKKIATYRDDEFKVPKSKYYNLIVKTKSDAQELNFKEPENKSHSKKRKHKLVEQGVSIKDQKATENHAPMEDPEQERVQDEKLNGEEGKMSKRSRTRQRQSKFKVPQARLKAYGKLPSESKNKKKN